MGETMVQKHLAVQDLSKLKVEELTPLTPEVISRQVRKRCFLFTSRHADDGV